MTFFKPLDKMQIQKTHRKRKTAAKSPLTQRLVFLISVSSLPFFIKVNLEICLSRVNGQMKAR